MARSEQDAARWLQVKGDLYSRAGQPRRGLALLLLATQLAPADAGIMRTLIGSFLASGDGRRALLGLERLGQLESEQHDHLLLRSRAFWLLGERQQARDCLRSYLKRRAQA
ncbi:type III secretion protein [Pseudomonas sp. LRF_L74]|uniref:type III secretion protein n=1 Tax=Pseudomonas sp. LRF_L74 TaxID=3369422 RepID=UPI003F60440E